MMCARLILLWEGNRGEQCFGGLDTLLSWFLVLGWRLSGGHDRVLRFSFLGFFNNAFLRKNTHEN